MENSEIVSALQDLIIRLQDAEKGYEEISKATSSQSLKKWTQKYAKERHQMHRNLEKLASLLGGETEVKTSLLGKMHRMFIDIKLNAIDDDYDSAIAEIHRGSNKLVEDYDKILDEMNIPSDIEALLKEQRAEIISEVESLTSISKN